METTTTAPALAGLLAAIVADSSWIDQAACGRSEFPDLWFAGDAEWNAEARKVCAACPVQQQCLERALAVDERHGIWGGTTQPQRSALKAKAGR